MTTKLSYFLTSLRVDTAYIKHQTVYRLSLRAASQTQQRKDLQ